MQILSADFVQLLKKKYFEFEFVISTAAVALELWKNHSSYLRIFADNVFIEVWISEGCDGEVSSVVGWVGMFGEWLTFGF